MEVRSIARWTAIQPRLLSTNALIFTRGDCLNSLVVLSMLKILIFNGVTKMQLIFHVSISNSLEGCRSSAFVHELCQALKSLSINRSSRDSVTKRVSHTEPSQRHLTRTSSRLRAVPFLRGKSKTRNERSWTRADEKARGYEQEHASVCSVW